MGVLNHQFSVGDKVTCIAGDYWTGVVVSVFLTRKGVERLVVEGTDGEDKGSLCIFSASQLSMVKGAPKRLPIGIEMPGMPRYPD